MVVRFNFCACNLRVHTFDARVYLILSFALMADGQDATLAQFFKSYAY